MRRAWLLMFVMCVLRLPLAFAVVGQAEKYDEFKQDELETFQTALTEEERAKQLERTVQMQKELQKVGGLNDSELQRKNEELKQLLVFPKRDHIRLELEGQYAYDSNINRLVHPHEKDDSLFDLKPNFLFDFSGRRTDLRWGLGGGKHWSVEFPVGDFWTAEERLRYRRKYLKKISHTIQSRIARTSTKTIEIDHPQIRWDSNQMTAFNYAFSPKVALNLEVDANNRYFNQEAFDQDSSFELKFSPSGFWSVTPKSRLALGYNYGSNRIHSKTGDTNTHEIHGGYFGKISTKSSASLDLSFSHQTPQSRDTAEVNTITTGLGYIWQVTGKTQMTLQLIRSLQNSTSDTITDMIVTKNDTYFYNESYSLSLNSRLTRKLTGVLNWNMSHSYTRVEKDGNKDNETTHWTFPTSLIFTYLLRRWAILTVGYTFSYQTGYEKTDRYRDHLWQTSLRFSF